MDQWIVVVSALVTMVGGTGYFTFIFAKSTESGISDFWEQTTSGKKAISNAKVAMARRKNILFIVLVSLFNVTDYFTRIKQIKNILNISL